MKQGIVISAIIYIIAIVIQANASNGEQFGVIQKVLPNGEVHVKPIRQGKQIRIGEKLYVRKGKKTIFLKATFPMFILTKCRLININSKSMKYLIKGMPVYRYNTGVKNSNSIKFKTGDAKIVNNMELVFIKGGTFTMGSSGNDIDNDEKPKHKVVVHDFWFGKYEVTQEQFYETMNYNPSFYAVGKSGKVAIRKHSIPSAPIGVNSASKKLPVDSVTWFEAVAFCNNFSKKARLPFSYKITVSKKKNDLISHTSVNLKKTAGGFRLPTEAEWEYACRAGSRDIYYWGDDMDDEYCWWEENSKNTVHVVGQKRSNTWGLNDMLGNISEWCWDWYLYDYYSGSDNVNPKGPDFGVERVIRGGSYKWNEISNRSALRFKGNPYSSIPLLTGFRIVLSEK